MGVVADVAPNDERARWIGVIGGGTAAGNHWAGGRWSALRPLVTGRLPGLYYNGLTHVPDRISGYSRNPHAAGDTERLRQEAGRAALLPNNRLLCHLDQRCRGP